MGIYLFALVVFVWAILVVRSSAKKDRERMLRNKTKGATTK